MAIPGVMSKFKIRELSGCMAPAQRGARAVFIKRDDSIDETPPPVAAVGQDEGGSRQTNGGLADQREPTRQDYLDALEKAARGRLEADPSRSYEQHYADALATPAGRKCYAMAH